MPLVSRIALKIPCYIYTTHSAASLFLVAEKLTALWSRFSELFVPSFVDMRKGSRKSVMGPERVDLDEVAVQKHIVISNIITLSCNTDWKWNSSERNNIQGIEGFFFTFIKGLSW